jgi:hypothetical protein
MFHRARLVLALCFTEFLYLAPGSVVTSSADAGERLGLEVRETAGLARRGYPAHALLELPRSVPATTKFRLLRDGKPVVAQFRPNGEQATAQWWLDFQTEMDPNETRKYTVEFGDDVPAGPERSSGHKLGQTDRAFSIANAPYITWTIPRDLKGFLHSVDFPPSEFVRPDSPGLLLRDRQGRQHVFSGTGRVLRHGTMAVALRFEKVENDAGLGNVRSTADLTFPAPVSWVEVDWKIDDSSGNVAALGLQLHLNLNKPAAATPTLVDLGAASTVYTSLHQGQEAELTAGPLSADARHAWKVLRGEHGRLVPFALGPKPSTNPRVEGWAHIMDEKRCLAVAIDAFARDTSDRISATADGTVTVWREFDSAKNAVRKRLRLWLHFVFFPPQLSAGASPQQMQAPLQVRMTQRQD